MHEGQVSTEKEILFDGFKYEEDFGLWKVFFNHNTIVYWNIKTSIIDRLATYTPRSK